MFNKEYDAHINAKVASTVASVNRFMKWNIQEYDFNLIDVFGFTVNNEGFSNGMFHLDNHHLGPKAISEIESQL